MRRRRGGRGRQNNKREEQRSRRRRRETKRKTTHKKHIGLLYVLLKQVLPRTPKRTILDSWSSANDRCFKTLFLVVLNVCVLLLVACCCLHSNAKQTKKNK